MAIDLIADVLADGIRLNCACEVYGSGTQLRTYLEAPGLAYVLRVRLTSTSSLWPGVKLTCIDAAARLADGLRWEIRSAG